MEKIKKEYLNKVKTAKFDIKSQELAYTVFPINKFPISGYIVINIINLVFGRYEN